WLERFDRATPVYVTVGAAGALGTAIVAAMPLMYPPPWSDFGAVDATRMLSVELRGQALGTTSANDFLPVGVLVIPRPQSSLIDSYESRGEADRLNSATLPTGATVTLTNQGPVESLYAVSSPSDFVFRMYTFYFPGWVARVDGRPVDIEV